MARVKGQWISLQISTADAVEKTVADEFAKNTYAHNITFRALKGSFNLYDKLVVRLDKKIFASYIATIKETKNSNYAEFTCGELQVIYPFLNLI